MTKGDRDLGMDRPISRRDFLNGVSVAVGASLIAAVGRVRRPGAGAFARRRRRQLPAGADGTARQPSGIVRSGPQYARRPHLRNRRRHRRDLRPRRRRRRDERPRRRVLLPEAHRVERPDSASSTITTISAATRKGTSSSSTAACSLRAAARPYIERVATFPIEGRELLEEIGDQLQGADLQARSALLRVARPSLGAVLRQGNVRHRQARAEPCRPGRIRWRR